ncbi:hypothetical protein [Allocoleopsis sp.]|uniref:hypothetical protein n=1 Tax=Allocoleopsis sp. TaxID=3088169 RepID=UPI002FCFF9EA
MTDNYTSENEKLEDLLVCNQRSLQKLERAIQMSQGQFSLILMCCNCSSMRRRMVKQLSKQCSIQIQEIILHPSVNTLFTTILTAIEEPPPPALMVFGLDSVVAIEQVLTATNLVRDEFPKHFPFPLILCINDELLQKLIRLAPDFKSWAANPIRFEDPKSQSLDMTPITA